MAAVETLRHGYERFIVLGAQNENNVGVIQRAPTSSYTTGTATLYGNTAYGNSTTTYSGGGPIFYGTNDADLIVQMLTPKDRMFSDGVDAKEVLGENWEKFVESGVKTCAG